MDVDTSSPAATVNIAAALPRLANAAPDRIAMRCPGRNGSYGLGTPRYGVKLTVMPRPVVVG